MNDFCLAVAQIPVRGGDIAANLATHLRVAAVAAAHGCHYLLFPELSLTGYEPAQAKALAMDLADRRLEPLRLAAVQHQLLIAVGAPLQREPGKPGLGVLLHYADGAVEYYLKRHLHPGEERYFAAGDTYRLVEVEGVAIAQAICADANHPRHAAACAQRGATLYPVGGLITAAGYPADSARLRQVSRQGMVVALANHCVPNGGWTPVGKSAIWVEGATLVAAHADEPVLLLARQRAGCWYGQQVAL